MCNLYTVPTKGTLKKQKKIAPNINSDSLSWDYVSMFSSFSFFLKFLNNHIFPQKTE